MLAELPTGGQWELGLFPELGGHRQWVLPMGAAPEQSHPRALPVLCWPGRDGKAKAWGLLVVFVVPVSGRSVLAVSEQSCPACLIPAALSLSLTPCPHS